MSVTEQQLKEFAKQVATNPAFPEVLERIQVTLFTRWVKGTPEERQIIGDLADHLGLFVKEIKSLYESIDDDKPINEE